MPSAVELMKTIKRAALDAVNASKPVEVCFGKVTQTSGLRVSIDQKLFLGDKQLIITESTVRNGLAVGDKVVLLRQQGGQKYIIMGKIV